MWKKSRVLGVDTGGAYANHWDVKSVKTI